MTYPLESLVFFDWETRAPVDIKKTGTYRYAEVADPIILTYCIGSGPVRIIQKQGRTLEWADLPGEFRTAFSDSSIYFIAWNAGFDRAVWNYSLVDSPYLAPARVLDAMAQAMASNLPPALDMASTATGGPGKQPDGKKLISMFSSGRAAPKDHPAEWDRFCSYAARDVAVMRDIWKHTRPLTHQEWRVYWANEAICERGIGVDLEFCAAASKLAIEDGTRAGRRLDALTKGVVTSIHQNIRLAEWIYDRLPSQEARDIMVTALIDLDEREEEDGSEPGQSGVRVEISIKRGIVERLLDWMEASGHQDSVLREVLELREFGASAAPKKYAAALAQETGGRLRGQITFNGAAQTGRFSGKGVQPQNLTRTPLGGDYGIFEPGAVDMISDGCTLEDLAAFGDREVPSRKLALLVRPAIVAPPGKTLIKADYSQIEARCLPWLANSPSAEKQLDYFRAVDADPSLPDLYTVAAAGMLRKAVDEITKQDRQIGKVSTLACGYQGGKGALMAMGAAYRLYVSPEEAQEIVDMWRAANPWASAFWGKHLPPDASYGLWGAAMRAYNDPGEPQVAGRIAFMYEPSYLGGTLFMRLPSGRLLTYPWCKWREYELKDKLTGKVTGTRKSLTFRRPGGMRALYGGLLSENATQACCADLLREALVVLEEGLLGTRLDVVLHAHDEIVAECLDTPAEVRRSLEALEAAMTFDRAWAKGFPLTVDSVVRWFYSAAKVKEAA